MSKQLPLQLRLLDHASFSNFVPGTNQLVADFLLDFLNNPQESVVYLWGNASTGKTHLLQALGQLAQQNTLQCAYLPLNEFTNYAPDALENLEDYPLLLIDEVDALINKPEWQEALFHLYNRMVQRQHKLVFAAHSAPQQLDLSLADLKSRLNAATIFQLLTLTDAEKMKALTQRAALRGIELPENVADYLLKYWPRDFASLMLALDQLDLASLIEQRKLTIPFVKKVMGL